MKCTICKTKYKKEKEKTRIYKKVKNKTVCEDCYNEVRRLSIVRKLSIETSYTKYFNLIKRIRLNEIKSRGKMKKKTIKCRFCKTLKNINLKNNSYVCDECDELIEKLTHRHKKKRNQIESMVSLDNKVKRKKKRVKRQLEGKKNYKTEWLEYKEYLLTEHWNHTRKRFLRSKWYKGVCFCCGSDKNLHVHHKTYKNIQNEPLRNLVCLCGSCHKTVHDTIKHQKNHKTKNDTTLQNCHIKLKELFTKGFKKSGNKEKIIEILKTS